jgi:hypothetical protein
MTRFVNNSAKIPIIEAAVASRTRASSYSQENQES